MPSEHNPIAELVHQIQQKWINEISPYPEIKLARWLIQPDQARLFEGFLKLESTQHGALPEVLVAMLAPFKTEKTYSIDLIENWIREFRNDEKTLQKLQSGNVPNTWNPEMFLLKPSLPNADYDDQFIKMLISFHEKMISKEVRLVVALFPYTIYDMDGLRRWLVSILKKNIPDAITFMIFDHVGEYYFDGIFKKFPETAKTLHINLDLDGAVNKIAKMGDANSPEVQFRECILEMGKAVQKKNQSELNKWGEKALQITQKSGLKSLFASAHIVYAGMLFNFKQYDKIDALLEVGLKIAIQGLKTEDTTCKVLVMQFYGYTGASKQMQKKMKDAIMAYEKQGSYAMEIKLPAMALTPYWQAYTLSKKNDPPRYKELLHKGYSAGKSMQKEEQLNSNFPLIAADYIKWYEENNKRDEAMQTNEELKQILGNDWKELAKKPGTVSPANTYQ